MRHSIFGITEMSVLLLASAALAASQGDAPAAATGRKSPAPEQIREAALEALQLMQSTWPVYVEKKTCFSCHHQALPMMASARARQRGLITEWDSTSQQAEFTRAFFAKRFDGKGSGGTLGGGAFTAGYGLAALAAADVPRDETTAAIVGYLLANQKEDGSWTFPSQRPPSQGSTHAATALAIRGLNHYAAEDNRVAIDERIARAREWLLASQPADTEDKTFHLFGLKWSGAPAKAIRKATKSLLAEQGEDGGWSQLPGMDSGVYATAEVLVALHEAGGVAVDRPAYRRGIKFLLDAQLDDGSWQVKTRAKPFQEYFESGFPHGDDQFISITATAWATMALIHASR